MVTRKEVEELLEKHTAKEFYDQTLAQTELLDHRSKVIVSHIWVEPLLEGIIIKKFKNYEDLPSSFLKKTAPKCNCIPINSTWVLIL